MKKNRNNNNKIEEYKNNLIQYLNNNRIAQID